MIDRIREKLFPAHRAKKTEKRRPAALRGIAHNIITVKAPNDIFTEAIFILRDDYGLNGSFPSDELLRQAREAADIYTASVSLRERWKDTLIIVLSVLLCAETAGIILFM